MNSFWRYYMRQADDQTLKLPCGKMKLNSIAKYNKFIKIFLCNQPSNPSFMGCSARARAHTHTHTHTQRRMNHTIRASWNKRVAFSNWTGSSFPSGMVLTKWIFSSAAKNCPKSSSLDTPANNKVNKNMLAQNF